MLLRVQAAKRAAADGGGGVRLGKDGKPQISEKVFQEQVRKAAVMAGWRFYHTWNSMRSVKGFPDCLLIKGSRMIVAELKREGGIFTPEQDDWLNAFEGVPGVEVFRLYPRDFDMFWEVLKAAKTEG